LKGRSRVEVQEEAGRGVSGENELKAENVMLSADIGEACIRRE